MDIEKIFGEIKEKIDQTCNETFSVQKTKIIPANIPLENFNWYLIPNLTCVFVDMIGSTKLALNKDSAKIYQVFVQSFVKTFNDFEAEYVDIKGDGGFALFTGIDSAIPALCAAVTFRTICNREIENRFLPEQILMHVGIDTGDALVKRIGLRGDKNNEVWLGTPVNTASKLASSAPPSTIFVSGRTFNILNQKEYQQYLINSCGCPNGIARLWGEQDNADLRIKSNKIYFLKSQWCIKHGQLFCKEAMEIYFNKKNN
ncbi:MAG: adenylate/guanylate cyclase domain-containing protein [Endomicrobiaceae bacterium]|nr:adenylate/guanylate cyclase domain-containing protein [Endomicrobiaceae bacterium]